MAGLCISCVEPDDFIMTVLDRYGLFKQHELKPNTLQAMGTKGSGLRVFRKVCEILGCHGVSRLKSSGMRSRIIW
jgi:hypothetical protein